MNNLLDLVNKWATRLTVRILSLLGTSEEGINTFVAAMEKRQIIVSEADKRILGKGRFIKWLIICLLLGGMAFIILKIIKLRK